MISGAKEDFLDVLFEDRNKEYGAYQLRKKYSRTLSLAFLFALGVFALAISIPAIVNLLNEEEVVDTRPKNRVLEISEIPEEIEEEKIEEITAPPVQAEIEFVAPTITAAEVAPENQMIDPNEIKPWQNIGNENIAGDSIIGIPEENVVIGDGAGGEEPLVFAEVQPQFPGGEDKMNEWLSENLRYPPYAKENEIQGKVVVRFVVDKNGEIGKIEIIKSMKVFDEEVLRVVKSMPKWKPGKQNGRSVPVWFVLPVVFNLK